MKKTALVLSVLLASASPVFAEIPFHEDSYITEGESKTGQKIFKKNLQKKCGHTSTHFAKKHTMEEWEEIKENGNFKEEVMVLCPKIVDDSFIKEEWVEPLYEFSVNFAKDTYRHPSC